MGTYGNVKLQAMEMANVAVADRQWRNRIDNNGDFLVERWNGSAYESQMIYAQAVGGNPSYGGVNFKSIGGQVNPVIQFNNQVDVKKGEVTVGGVFKTNSVVPLSNTKTIGSATNAFTNIHAATLHSTTPIESVNTEMLGENMTAGEPFVLYNDGANKIRRPRTGYKGGLTQINDDFGGPNELLAMDTQTFVYVFDSQRFAGTVHAQVGKLLDGTVTWYPVTSLDVTDSMSVCKLTSTTFYITYRKSDNTIQARVGTVSGTTISYSAEVQIAAAGNGNTDCVALSSTRVVSYYRNTVIGVNIISGLPDVTGENALGVMASDSNDYSMAGIDSDRVIFASILGGNVDAIVIDASTTTPTKGSILSVDTGVPTNHPNIAMINSTHAIIAYTRVASTGTMRALQIQTGVTTPIKSNSFDFSTTVGSDRVYNSVSQFINFNTNKIIFTWNEVSYAGSCIAEITGSGGSASIAYGTVNNFAPWGGTTYTAVVSYDTDRWIAIMANNNGYQRTYSRLGRPDGDGTLDITWQSEEIFKEVVTTTISFAKLTNTKGVVFYQDTNANGFARVFDINSDRTVSFGTEVAVTTDMITLNYQSGKQLITALSPTVVVMAWINNAANILIRTYDISGSTLTPRHAEFNPVGGTKAGLDIVALDSERFVMTYRSTTELVARVGQINPGASPTMGTQVTIDGGGGYSDTTPTSVVKLGDSSCVVVSHTSNYKIAPFTVSGLTVNPQYVYTFSPGLSNAVAPAGFDIVRIDATRVGVILPVTDLYTHFKVVEFKDALTNSFASNNLVEYPSQKFLVHNGVVASAGIRNYASTISGNIITVTYTEWFTEPNMAVLKGVFNPSTNIVTWDATPTIVNQGESGSQDRVSTNSLQIDPTTVVVGFVDGSNQSFGTLTLFDIVSEKISGVVLVTGSVSSSQSVKYTGQTTTEVYSGLTVGLTYYWDIDTRTVTSIVTNHPLGIAIASNRLVLF